LKQRHSEKIASGDHSFGFASSWEGAVRRRWPSHRSNMAEAGLAIFMPGISLRALK
jgi:hypothetical protein